MQLPFHVPNLGVFNFTKSFEKGMFIKIEKSRKVEAQGLLAAVYSI